MKFVFPLSIICLLGAVLRGMRVTLRWNQIALAYAAYQAPFESALMEGHFLDALATFFGLHPPFYSLLFAGIHQVFGSIGTIMLVSLLLSTLSIALVGYLGRAAFGPTVGLISALVMAASLYHQHYSLELNNYPLLVCLVAGSQLAFVQRLKGKLGGGWVVLQALAHWTHLLGALIGLAQALAVVLIRSLRRQGLWAIAWIALLTLPILPEIYRLLGAGSTYHNEVGGPFDLISDVLSTLVVRFQSPGSVLLLCLAMAFGVTRGSRYQPQRRVTRYLALSIVVVGAGTLILTVYGITAAHQYPYYLLILPGAAVLAARGVVRLGRLTTPLVTLVLLGPSVAVSVQESYDGWQVWRGVADTPHAIHGATKHLFERHETQGSVLWLIAPALLPDDEKIAPDGVYGSINPFWSCAFYEPRAQGFEATDFEQGQPYACRPWGGEAKTRGALGAGDVAIYSFTAVYPNTMPALAETHLLRGTAIEAVLYDFESTPDYLPDLTRVLTIAAERRGAALTTKLVNNSVLFSLTPQKNDAGAGQ